MPSPTQEVSQETLKTGKFLVAEHHIDEHCGDENGPALTWFNAQTPALKALVREVGASGDAHLAVQVFSDNSLRTFVCFDCGPELISDVKGNPDLDQDSVKALETRGLTAATYMAYGVIDSEGKGLGRLHRLEEFRGHDGDVYQPHMAKIFEGMEAALALSMAADQHKGPDCSLVSKEATEPRGFGEFAGKYSDRAEYGYSRQIVPGLEQQLVTDTKNDSFTLTLVDQVANKSLRQTSGAGAHETFTQPAADAQVREHLGLSASNEVDSLAGRDGDLQDGLKGGRPAPWELVKGKDVSPAKPQSLHDVAPKEIQLNAALHLASVKMRKDAGGWVATAVVVDVATKAQIASLTTPAGADHDTVALHAQKVLIKAFNSGTSMEAAAKAIGRNAEQKRLSQIEDWDFGF